jgi:ELWxxDGT repeat protein
VLNDKALLLPKDDSIWVTNGTAAGTVKLVNTVSYVDSGGGQIFKGKFFFSGLNTASGGELWVTDGTAGGTNMLKDINVNSANSPLQISSPIITCCFLQQTMVLMEENYG